MLNSIVDSLLAQVYSPEFSWSMVCKGIIWCSINSLICHNQCLTFCKIKSLGIQLDFNQITASWIFNYVFAKPYIANPSKSLLLFKIITFLVFPQQQFVTVVQSLSRVQLFATPWTAVQQASLSITISLSLLKLMCIKSVMPSNHFIFCHPLLLLPSAFPSFMIFSNKSALCIRWPKYWSFSSSVSPSSEYLGLISFRIDRFYLLAVWGTLKCLLQHHNSKLF